MAWLVQFCVATMLMPLVQLADCSSPAATSSATAVASDNAAMIAHAEDAHHDTAMSARIDASTLSQDSTPSKSSGRDVVPVKSPSDEPDPDDNHVDPQINALLDELEASHRELRGFVANIRYDQYDPVLERTEIRLGQLIYARFRASDGAEQEPAQRFAILFDQEIIGRRRRDRLQHYVFDGRWLAEIDHSNRQFIKREIVQPGRTLDPLKLGEGPFPMPIGQSRAEVLRRFEVSTATLPDDGPLAGLEHVDGLTLVPRPSAPEAEQFEQVQVYYDQHTRLPVGVITVETNGQRRTVWLRDVQRDPEMTEDLRSKLNIETPSEREWNIDIRPWQS